jgi:polyisoprenoid-binding protein YceI
MKHVLIALGIVGCLLRFSFASAQNLMGKDGVITFYSKTPVEDIKAINSKVLATVNPANSQIAIRMEMTDFIFPKKLMQEHFNENYVESDKYPRATFAGVISPAIDFTKPGTYEVTANGKLNLHNVTKDAKLTGTVTVDAQGNATIDCKFPIKLEDYNVQRPAIVMLKIADVMDCTAVLSLKPIAKK